jgi:hypothetical protein
MKIWVFVEGESDRLALAALWSAWSEALHQSGWGIRVVPLQDKSRYFRKIGPHAAQKLAEGPRDLVVGLPDLYPNRPYEGTEFEHRDLVGLQNVQKQLVSKGLHQVYGEMDSVKTMQRFFPSALKHDLEMLLLASADPLRLRLKTKDSLGNWRKPPEDQNQDKPPKRVVEDLFRTKLGRAYLDTTDAAAILRNTTLRDVIFDGRGTLQCPAFRSAVDWVVEQTGVAGY